jgi:hypothetical protein
MYRYYRFICFSALLFLMPLASKAVCQNLIVQNGTTICQGASFTISLTNASPVSVLWSTGATTNSITVSPSATTTYYVTVDDGSEVCTDSITLEVAPEYNYPQTVSRCQGQSYVLPNGTTVTSSGTYVSNLLTVFGCDSVINTTVTFYPTFATSQTVSRCQGQSYVLPSGTTVTVTGSYISNLTTVRGCDSVITSNVTFYPVYNFPQSVPLCQGDSYVLPNGNSVSASGTYTSAFQTARGCDSNYVTTVTVYPVYSSTQTVSRCQGDSYVLPNGTTVSTSGTYVSNLTSIRSCDSVITTVITFYPVYSGSETVSRCQGESYVLPSGTTVTTTGVYTSTLNTVRNCDSVITSNVTFYPNVTRTEYVSTCQGTPYILPNGNSVTTAGTYTSVLTTSRGCDSTIITNLSVRNTYSIVIDTSICQGQSYVLPNGNTVTAAGTYINTLTTSLNCDSVITTNLTVNRIYNLYRTATICDNESYLLPSGLVVSAAGTYSSRLLSSRGCDSTIVTTLAVNPSYEIIYPVDICQGVPYTLPGGQVVTTSGMYRDTFVSQRSCDSVIVTDLTVNPVYTINRTDSICQGQTYVLPGGRVVSLAGTYTVTLTTVAGCDSIIITNLRVNPVSTVPYSTTICQGEVHYLPNGDTATSTGMYARTIRSSLGCDSTVMTSLTVYPVYSILLDEAVCQGQYFQLPGGSLTDTAGTYPVILSTVNGCDSMVTTNLTINPVYQSSQAPVICQGQPFTLPGGQSVFTADIYIDTLFTESGCDSIITTDLTVNPTYRFTRYEAICQGDSFLLPDNVAVYAAGTYQVTFPTELGCDSTIITNLTVFPVYTTFVDTTICSGDTYLLADSSQASAPGAYPVLLQSIRGCDSTVITNLTLRPVYTVDVFDTICLGDVAFLPDGQPIYAQGAYPVTLTSSVNCDSVVITNLTVNPIYNISRNVTICQGSAYVLPNGQAVTASATYPVVLQTVDGCDSLIVTNLTVQPNYTINRPVSICQGDTFYLPNGFPVFSAGFYTSNYVTQYGCDSIIRTIVNVRPVYNSSVSASVCQGTSYRLPDGRSVTAAGTYTSSFQTVYGCDSIIVTTLTVYPTFTTSRNVSICQGSSYILANNTIVTQSGTYTVTVPTINGCDSTVTIHLSVGSVISNTVYPSICQGETYTLPGGQIVGSSGTYNGNFTTSTGCDSAVTYVLSVYPNYDYQLVESACDNQIYLLPDGTPVTSSGTYYVNLQSSGGCDSSFTIYLTVNSSYNATVNATICQGQVYTLPNGGQVTTPGGYLTPFITPGGCDSTIFTLLQVIPPSTWNQSVDLCISDTYLLPDGTPIDSGGIYQSTVTGSSGCDSLVFTFVTMVGFQPSTIQGASVTLHWSQETYLVPYVAGRFYFWTVTGGRILSGQGTNSIVVEWDQDGIGSVVLNQYDTQCSYYDTLSVNSLYTSVSVAADAGQLSAFPVPFTERLMVNWPQTLHPAAVVLYDIAGRIVLEQVVEAGLQAELNTADLAPGCYLLGLKGETASLLRVIRQ